MKKSEKAFGYKYFIGSKSGDSLLEPIVNHCDCITSGSTMLDSSLIFATYLD